MGDLELRKHTPTPHEAAGAKPKPSAVLAVARAKARASAPRIVEFASVSNNFPRELPESSIENNLPCLSSVRRSNKGCLRERENGSDHRDHKGG